MEMSEESRIARAKIICEKVDQGLSYAKIALIVKLGRGRVGQIYNAVLDAKPGSLFSGVRAELEKARAEAKAREEAETE